MANSNYKYHEYDIRNQFREAGFKCERVPCSGSARGFKGDLVLKVFDINLLIDVAYRSKKRAYPKILFSEINKQNFLCLNNEVYLMNLNTFISWLKGDYDYVIETIYLGCFSLEKLNQVLKNKIVKYDLAVFKTNVSKRKCIRNVCIRKERFEELIQEIGGYYERTSKD